ncbi:hypothetical protein [Pseudomonas sp. R3-52-08]|uniref:hypothetical protein n=1 Tax=Pseudomonas sp. R3-52-08 TaxID=1173284 RepID=UPI000F5810C6|nr:hypothetical protein [Pseudomonas sp. R3-52-08]AZF23021.1 Phosphomannomutase [Pseudomonas sp. R3-52-08]
MPELSAVPAHPFIAVSAYEQAADTAKKVVSKPHTGVSVAGENYTPADKHSLVSAFINDTLQNVNYESKENLERRAKNFFKNIEAEMAVDLGVEKDLLREDSPATRLSSHMVHLIRGLWAESTTNPAFREQLHKELLAPDNDPDNVFLAGKDHPGTLMRMKSLHAMLVNAEQGPLTHEQAREGAEVTFGIKILGETLKKHDPLLANIDANASQGRVSANRLVDGKKTNHFDDLHGTDLRNDLGTQVRDALGASVMLGTSGSASDVASTLRYAARSQGQSMWPQGMTETQGREGLTGLMFNLMRNKIADTAQGFYDEMRHDLHGLPPKHVEPSMIFSHSYPEVVSGVEMTLNNEKPTDRGAMIRSTQLAQAQLETAFTNRQ